MRDEVLGEHVKRISKNLTPDFPELSIPKVYMARKWPVDAEVSFLGVDERGHVQTDRRTDTSSYIQFCFEPWMLFPVRNPH